MSRSAGSVDEPILFGTTAADFPERSALLDRAAFESGHHVALAWVFDPSWRRILLVEHSTMSWSCPGGHVDVGETLIEAAERELSEETGVSAERVGDMPVTLGRTVGCARYPHVRTVHWAAGYLFIADDSQPVTCEPDASARWFDVGDLPTGRVSEIDVVVDRLRTSDAH